MHEFHGHVQESKLGGATLIEAGGLGAALRPPMGPGRSPCWGPGGEAPGIRPRKLLDFRDFIDLKTSFDCRKPAIFFIFTSDHYMLEYIYKPACAPHFQKWGEHMPPAPSPLVLRP